MSRMSDKLARMISEKIDYPCEVWYNRKYPQGWMFKTDKTVHPDRLGYVYKQAERFIEEFDWSWIKQGIKERIKGNEVVL